MKNYKVYLDSGEGRSPRHTFSVIGTGIVSASIDKRGRPTGNTGWIIFNGDKIVATVSNSLAIEVEELAEPTTSETKH